jgi:hypothetical protein
MAIVINGSGTVTGISVGGLPDDIVDAGTLADNAVGLAQMAGGTDGNIITYDTSGNPAVVATGSSGQVLTSAGADAVPTMATLSAGKVLQVVQGVKVDTFSSTTVDWVDITGLTVDITPSSTSSKILVSFITNLSGSTTGGHTSLVRCLRDSTAIGGGTQVGTNRKSASGLHCNRDTVEMNWISYEYLDSPSTTSATTYKVQLFGEGAATHYINRSGNDGDFAYHGRYASSITVMEIGA